jgi:8-oxo-dGTP pyrophosphatase MutT (NUDIX family)/uncharacterized C2H2 Zn-finger protein
MSHTPYPRPAPGRHIDHWEEVYDSGRYSFYRQDWRHVLHFSEDLSGAAALVIDSLDRVALIECYRYTVDRIVLEIPRGLADPGETMAQCAAREFEEETGIPVPAEEMTYLGRIDPDTGILGTSPHLYGIRLEHPFPTPKPDHSEALGVNLMAWCDFQDGLATGRINDPFAFVAAQRLAAIEKNVSYAVAVGRTATFKTMEIVDETGEVLVKVPSCAPEKDFQDYRQRENKGHAWRFAKEAYR